MLSIPLYSILNPAPSSKRAEICPSTFTSPDVGVSTPVIILSMVDLPEPFVPIIPTVSPFFTERLTLLSARCSLNFFFPESPSESFRRSIGLSYNLYDFVRFLTSIAMPFSMHFSSFTASISGLLCHVGCGRYIKFH